MCGYHVLHYWYFPNQYRDQIIESINICSIYKKSVNITIKCYWMNIYTCAITPASFETKCPYLFARNLNFDSFALLTA